VRTESGGRRGDADAQSPLRPPPGGSCARARSCRDGPPAVTVAGGVGCAHSNVNRRACPGGTPACAPRARPGHRISLCSRDTDRENSTAWWRRRGRPCGGAPRRAGPVGVTKPDAQHTHRPSPAHQTSRAPSDAHASNSGESDVRSKRGSLQATKGVPASTKKAGRKSSGRPCRHARERGERRTSHPCMGRLGSTRGRACRRPGPTWRAPADALGGAVGIQSTHPSLQLRVVGCVSRRRGIGGKRRAVRR